MAKKSKSPSFICELKLEVSQKEHSILSKRFEMGRFFYNACLAEALKRLHRMRQSRAFQQACLETDKKKRTALFNTLKKQFQFQEYALHAYATRLSHSYLGDHIDSNTAQKLASRAFKAVEKILLKKAKKVRFKGKNQLSSLEGKTNTSGIRFKENTLLWNKLKINALLPQKDEVIDYALQQKIKYVRLVQRNLKGKTYFYAQLILEGRPFKKKKKGQVQLSGKVGLDLGPSSVAISAEGVALLKPFCAELKPNLKEKRRLQRKLDRQRRANNPQNYEKDGQIKKGKKKWNSSKRYENTKIKLAERERKLAAQRKTSHGTLLNFILMLGTLFCFEKLSYKAWQKGLFGKSVSRNAPGQFIQRLKHKAESAGAKTIEINTRETKLSQTCHCGRVKKKKLSERLHSCECGVSAQRDLYSAYLATFVDEENKLHADQAQKDWSSADVLLQTAWNEAYQTASLPQLRRSFGNPYSQRQSGSSAESKKAQSNAWNAVASDSQLDGESP